VNILKAAYNFVVGAPKITTDIFDKENGLLTQVGGFINDLDYSDAEKMRDIASQGKAATEFVKATLGENTEKSKTRRELAVIWIRTQLYLVLTTAICVPLAAFFPNPGKEIFTMMYQLTTCTLMITGTGCVMVYFFGSYGWGTYVSKKEK